jgi:hypothetical protein
VGTGALGNNGFVITGATGKPFVAASSSLSLPNASLQNSSVTVNTSAPLGGGGAVSLGSTLTFTCASCATFSYPFTLGSNFNSTSTGQIIIASSTIGNGAQNGGITISGGATTTSSAYFAANVGIQAQAPFSKFQIGTATGASTAALSNTASIFTTDVNAGTPSGFAMMLVSKNTAANNVGPTIGFGGESGQGVTPYPYATIRGAKDVAGTYAGYLSFGTTDSSSNIGQERIRITSTGNVGIGTTSPATKLRNRHEASTSRSRD